MDAGISMYWANEVGPSLIGVQYLQGHRLQVIRLRGARNGRPGEGFQVGDFPGGHPTCESES